MDLAYSQAYWPCSKPNLPGRGRLNRQASALLLPPVTTWWARGRVPLDRPPPRPVASREREQGSRAVPWGARLGSPLAANTPRARTKRWIGQLTARADRQTNGLVP